MLGPQLKHKLGFFMCSKKCGDNAASVAIFVATLVFTLDTADLEQQQQLSDLTLFSQLIKLTLMKRYISATKSLLK